MRELIIGVGMLAEDHLEDSLLGRTQTAILADQFFRLAMGDSCFYHHMYANEKDCQCLNDRWNSESELKGVTMANILARNSCYSDTSRSPFVTNHIDCGLGPL